MCGKEIIEWSRACGALILGEPSPTIQSIEKRESKRYLKIRCTDVLGTGKKRTATNPYLKNGERKRSIPMGIAIADTVFVPLEDGDRTEA